MSVMLFIVTVTYMEILIMTFLVKYSFCNNHVDISCWSYELHSRLNYLVGPHEIYCTVLSVFIDFLGVIVSETVIRRDHLRSHQLITQQPPSIIR